MTKFRRQFDPDYKRKELKGEWPKTVVRADLGLTVRELMDRHTRFPDDYEIPKTNYSGDEDIPMDLDISEIKDMKDNLIKNDASVKKHIEEQRKLEEDKRLAERHEKRVQEEVEKRLRSKPKPKQDDE